VVSILPPSRFEPRLSRGNKIKTDGGKGKRRGGIVLAGWLAVVAGTLGGVLASEATNNN
jgi:hypothetical protein